MTRICRFTAAALLLAGTSMAIPTPRAALAQEQQPAKRVHPPIAETPIRTPSFDLALRSDTQTLSRLSPTGDATFDFTPGAREAERAGDGYVHIGDINLRLRKPGGAWTDFASAHDRQPIRLLPAGGSVLAAADITASLGASPIRI